MKTNRPTVPSQLDPDDPLWVIRGQAINAYAMLENALCFLFEPLVPGMHIPVAATIFHKFRNLRDATDVLGKLLMSKHGDKYKVFWKSFSNKIDNLMGKRNNIVHWHVGKDANHTDLHLVQPDRWLDIPGKTPLSTSDLLAFIDKCNWAITLCMRFSAILGPPEVLAFLGEEQWQPWRDIFQQEVAYPPPVGSLLFQTPTKLESRPPPSQELPLFEDGAGI